MVVIEESVEGGAHGRTTYIVYLSRSLRSNLKIRVNESSEKHGDRIECTLLIFRVESLLRIRVPTYPLCLRVLQAGLELPGSWKAHAGACARFRELSQKQRNSMVHRNCMDHTGLGWGRL